MPTNNEETLFQRYEREKMINKKIESEINSAQTEATGFSEMTTKKEVLRLCDKVGIDFNSFHSENGKEICLCNGSQEIEKFTKLIKLVEAEELDVIAALINDDAAAISYQSSAQYRSALLKAIRTRKDK